MSAVAAAPLVDETSIDALTNGPAADVERHPNWIIAEDRFTVGDELMEQLDRTPQMSVRVALLQRMRGEALRLLELPADSHEHMPSREQLEDAVLVTSQVLVTEQAWLYGVSWERVGPGVWPQWVQYTTAEIPEYLQYRKVTECRQRAQLWNVAAKRLDGHVRPTVITAIQTVVNNYAKLATVAEVITP